MDTASCVLSCAQDRCEIGAGRPLAWLVGLIGKTFWLPLASVRTTTWYWAVSVGWLGTQPGVSSGSVVNASLAPSGLTAPVR